MDKDTKDELDKIKNRVTQIEKRRPNETAIGLVKIPEPSLSDVTGTPNIVFDPTGADAIISNLQAQNNLMNGVIDTLVSSFNKLLNNIKNQ